jgi:hypothetical protein
VTQVVPAPAVAAVPPAPVSAEPEPARRRSATWPLAALVGLAAVIMAVAFVLGNARPEGAGDVAPTPTASAVATPQPTPTASPEWLAEELERLEEECGPDVVQAEQANLADMGRGQARNRVDELIQQCSGEGGDD